MNGKLISQLNEQLEAVKGNELLLVESEGKSKKMPISLLATAGAGGVNVGDIVLPDKSTMTLESYKASGRSDAIGVVFDKFKGLFVRKTLVTASLATWEGNGETIFYSSVNSYNFTNGREILLQCKDRSDSDKFAQGFPAFYKALQINQDCYLPSYEELQHIFSRISEELNFLEVSYDPGKISSCTWNGVRDASIKVFYGDGTLENRWTTWVGNPDLQFFVIDFL